MSEPITEQPTGAPKKAAPKRSPSYPCINLKEALEKAEAFHSKERRNAAQRDVGVVHWGYTPKSSGGKQALAALRAFGLMEPEGAMKLTETALRVLLDKRDPSPERDAFVRKMALLPPIHKRLWERYQTDLPSHESLRHSLIFDEGFNENTVDEFIKEYKATLEFAGLRDSGKMPPEEEGRVVNPPGGSAMEVSAIPTPKGYNPPPAPSTTARTGTLSTPASSQILAPAEGEGALFLRVPFRGSVLTVRIDSQGERLTAAHVSRVREFLELAEKDLTPESRWRNVRNLRMKEDLETGEAVDVSGLPRTPEGYYILPPDSLALLKSNEAPDYCDSKEATWIWSIGRHLETEAIHASKHGDLYENPAYECLWIR